MTVEAASAVVRSPANVPIGADTRQPGLCVPLHCQCAVVVQAVVFEQGKCSHLPVQLPALMALTACCLTVTVTKQLS